MSAALRPLTLAEFLDWERAQPEKWEFDGTQPVAMTGVSIAHARLLRRFVEAVGARLRGGCEAFGGDLKVITPTGRLRYPDAVVVCGPLDPKGDTVDPTVVLEILSPSTALTDRRVKPNDYASVPSIMAYVILEQDQPRTIVLRRATEWQEDVVIGNDAILSLPEIDVAFPLGLLYA